MRIVLESMHDGCNRSRGFTLFELLIAMSVILILAAGSLGIYMKAKNKSEKRLAKMQGGKTISALCSEFAPLWV